MNVTTRTQAIAELENMGRRRNDDKPGESLYRDKLVKIVESNMQDPAYISRRDSCIPLAQMAANKKCGGWCRENADEWGRVFLDSMTSICRGLRI